MILYSSSAYLSQMEVKEIKMNGLDEDLTKIQRLVKSSAPNLILHDLMLSKLVKICSKTLIPSSFTPFTANKPENTSQTFSPHKLA